jgi:hypothetical protein
MAAAQGASCGEDDAGWWERVRPVSDPSKPRWKNLPAAASLAIAQARGELDPKFRSIGGATTEVSLWKSVWERCREIDPTFFDQADMTDTSWPAVKKRLSNRRVRHKSRAVVFFFSLEDAHRLFALHVLHISLCFIIMRLRQRL